MASDIHLSEAIDELLRIAPLRGKPAWLFPVTSERPVGGCWYLKAQVGQAMGHSDWLLQDLTRTATTSVVRCGVAPHVADKVLNHISGTIRAAAGVYNCFDYRDERAAALDALGGWGWCTPGTAQGNVVALRGETRFASPTRSDLCAKGQELADA